MVPPPHPPTPRLPVCAPLGCRLAYANALLRMITEFSGLYPFVFLYVMHANEDTWLAVGVCLQAITRLMGVPVATRIVRGAREPARALVSHRLALLSLLCPALPCPCLPSCPGRLVPLAALAPYARAQPRAPPPPHTHARVSAFPRTRAPGPTPRCHLHLSVRHR